MPQINLNEFFKSSKAYLIAVGDYRFPSVTNLSSPKRDVAALKEVLEQYHGFTVPQLTDVLPNPLINPDSSQLLDFLDKVAAREDDRVVLYFAGHGIAMDSEGEPEGYLLATDAEPGNWGSFIKMSEVLKRIGGMKARHLLIILDCCYSGAFRWAQNTRGPGSDVPKTIYYERFSLYAKNKAWQVLTSSAHDQKAIDTLRLGKREQEGDGNLSPFAQILVDALKTGEADMRYGNTKPDGVITITELSFYLQNRIFEQLYRENIHADKQQVPSLFPITDAAAGNYGSGEFVFLNPSQANDNSVKLLNSTHTNPYKGLESYGRGDDKIFYGRQRVLDGWQEGTASYIGLIAAAQKYQVLIVTGPSGIGKSSLVKAGLLSLFPENDIVDIRPGKTPFQQHEIKLNELNKTAGRKVLLIDQFEELITVCDSEEERRKFDTLVAALAEKHIVILTVRSDFENQLKDASLLANDKDNTGKKYRFIVPPFSREEIQQVVTQPASQESLEFKPRQSGAKEAERFINKIVDEAFQNPGSLPLLSMALRELWDKKDGNNLLETVYADFGGLGGILDKKFIKEYDALAEDPYGQELFRQLVFRMISFEGARTSKRRVYTNLDDLSNSPSTDDELRFFDSSHSVKIKAIASKLVVARLLRGDTDEFEKPYIEPSHDALLRTSSLVAKWIKPMLEKIQLHKLVSDVSISYQRSNMQERKDYLSSWANHPRLLQVKQEISGWLNSIERDFIDHAYARKVSVKKVRNWTFGIVGIVVSCLAVFAGFQAFHFAQEAKKNKALYLAAESDKFGATEKLALLRKAYAICQDTSIYKKIQTLFNEYDYYSPFAIAKWDAKDSIDHMAFSKQQSGINMVLKGGKRVIWDFVKDSMRDDMAFHPASYAVSSDEKQVYVLDRKNYKVKSFAYTALHGSYVQADSGYINLLVSDSMKHTYALRLNSKMEVIHKKQITVLFDHTGINYFANSGYFTISENMLNRYLYNTRGELIDAKPSDVNIIGLHTINGKLFELISKDNVGIALVEAGSVKAPRFLAASLYVGDNTTFSIHPLQDSVILIGVYEIQPIGQRGQSTELYLMDLKSNKLTKMFDTSFSFKPLELSADKTMAIGISENGSCYIFDLKQQQVKSVTHYDGLENAVFRGDDNVYCVTAKSRGGYTTAVFDSAGQVLNNIEYSYKPLSIQIEPGNKFIAMLFPLSSILVWELHPAFNPRPWGDELEAESSARSFDVGSISTDSAGSYIDIEAAIIVGYPAPKSVYYYNNKLHIFSMNDDSAVAAMPSLHLPLIQYPTNFYSVENKVAYDFIYRDKARNLLLACKIKSLTGYDLNSKDSLKGLFEKGFYVGDAFDQLFLVGEGTLHLFEKKYPACPDVFSPGEVVAGALLNAGNNVLMITRNGTVYIKRTRRYVNSFIAVGYTIPPNPVMEGKIKI